LQFNFNLSKSIGYILQR